MLQLFKNLTCFDETCPSNNKDKKDEEIVATHCMVYLPTKKQKAICFCRLSDIDHFEVDLKTMPMIFNS